MDHMKNDLAKIFPKVNEIKSFSQTQNCSITKFSCVSQSQLNTMSLDEMSVHFLIDWKTIQFEIQSVKTLAFQMLTFSLDVQNTVQKQLIQFKLEHQKKLNKK